MTPINNSDTAWLIVTDFNQDNGKFYEELREDVYNPLINQWYYENKCFSVVGDCIGGIGGYVGVGTVGDCSIGGYVGGYVGVIVGGYRVGD